MGLPYCIHTITHTQALADSSALQIQALQQQITSLRQQLAGSTHNASQGPLMHQSSSFSNHHPAHVSDDVPQAHPPMDAHPPMTNTHTPADAGCDPTDSATDNAVAVPVSDMSVPYVSDSMSDMAQQLMNAQREATQARRHAQDMQSMVEELQCSYEQLQYELHTVHNQLEVCVCFMCERECA